MLSDFRAWLDAELKLLGNASHHAYAFGQANMAKRALERFDADVADRVAILLERGEAAALLTALATLADREPLPPPLAALAERLRATEPAT